MWPDGGVGGLDTAVAPDRVVYRQGTRAFRTTSWPDRKQARNGISCSCAYTPHALASSPYATLAYPDAYPFPPFWGHCTRSLILLAQLGL